jgi:hypothetical protein
MRRSRREYQLIEHRIVGKHVLQSLIIVLEKSGRDLGYICSNVGILLTSTSRSACQAS